MFVVEDGCDALIVTLHGGMTDHHAALPRAVRAAAIVRLGRTRYSKAWDQ